MGNKKRGNFMGIVIIAAVLAVGATAFYLRPSDDGKTIIRVTKAVRGTVTSSVTATGTLQPLTTVQVKSNTGGTVVKLAVQEGERVKKNQLIALIDPTDMNIALDEATANLNAATSKVLQTQDQWKMANQQNAAQVQNARQNVEACWLKYLQAKEQAGLQKTTTVTSIQQAEQNLTSAKAHLTQAEEIARVQPDLTQAAINQAQSTLANAQSALEQEQTATVPQTQAQAQSDYDQAKANMDYAQTNLKRQQALYDKGYVPLGTVDTAVQSAEVARATLANAKKKLDTVKQQTDQDLQQAKMKVAESRAALDNAIANKSLDVQRQQDVLQARASVKLDEAALTSAKANGVQDALRLQDAATAYDAWKQAKAALAVAQANLMQDSINHSNIVQARAGVEQNKAAVHDANVNVNYCTILAPCDGIILKKWSDVGTIVTSGRTVVTGSGTGVSIVDMANTSKMFVLVNVDETDIAQVALKQKVDITLDAYPDEIFDGFVTEVQPESTVVSNVTTLAVTVEIDMPDARLKSGMDATCEFITGRKTDALIVPNEAVKEDDTGSYVQIMETGKTEPVKRRVTTGLVGNDTTEILDGVKENERIVTAIILPKKATTSTSAPPGGGPGGMGGGGMRMR